MRTVGEGWSPERALRRSTTTTTSERRACFSVCPVAAASPSRAEEELRAQSVQIMRPGILTPAGVGSLGEGSSLLTNRVAAFLARSGRCPCRLGARRLESTGGEDVAGARELCGVFPSSQPGSPLRAPTNPQNTQTHALNTHTYTHPKKSASDLRIPHTDRRRGPSTRSELPREQFQIGTEK